MSVLLYLFDFIVHIDRHLTLFVQSSGGWIYLLLFLIVFIETGLVVMPFLPGDSLLFVAGAMAGTGLLNIFYVLLVFLVAAFLGDQCNFRIGYSVRRHIFSRKKSRFFNRDAFLKAHDFYERYGAITIIFARFMPFLRTFVPFVAGTAEMSSSRFTLFNAVGAVLWVGGVVGLGYAFGNIPFIKNHLELFIWGLLIIPFLILIITAWRRK
jgi:membrane-associated protein